MTEILIRAAEPDDMADMTEAWNQPLAVRGTLQVPFTSLDARRKRFEVPTPGVTPFHDPRQHAVSLAYANRPDYKAALVGVGLPEVVAALLSDSSTGASKGALFDEGHQLSQLLGRPTTPLATVVAEALAV